MSHMVSSPKSLVVSTIAIYCPGGFIPPINGIVRGKRPYPRSILARGLSESQRRHEPIQCAYRSDLADSNGCPFACIVIVVAGLLAGIIFFKIGEIRLNGLTDQIEIQRIGWRAFIISRRCTITARDKDQSPCKKENSSFKCRKMFHSHVRFVFKYSVAKKFALAPYNAVNSTENYHP